MENEQIGKEQFKNTFIFDWDKYKEYFSGLLITTIGCGTIHGMIRIKMYDLPQEIINRPFAICTTCVHTTNLVEIAEIMKWITLGCCAGVIILSVLGLGLVIKDKM